MQLTAAGAIGTVVVLLVGGTGLAAYLGDGGGDTQKAKGATALVASVQPPDTEGDTDGPEMPVATNPLASTALRCGLSAEALAAVGVDSGGVSAVLAAFVAEHESDATALATADAAYAGQRANADRLRRAIRSREGTPEDVQANVTALASVRGACDTAEAAREARVDALFEAATAGLSGAQVTKLQTLRSNRESWRFPAQYMVVQRSEEDWVRLRECLGNEAKAPEIGDELDSACQSWLASVRAATDVATAAANLSANGGAARYAWNLYFAE